MEKYDVVVLGGGPGGYVAAIRASQLGKKVAIIEKDKLGGVCLNRGCIPTKALLKSAHSVHELKSFSRLGINVELKSLDAAKAVKRAASVSERIVKGVVFLMKKNNIDVLNGEGRLLSKNKMHVRLHSGEEKEIEATNFILATGGRYNSFPGLEHDEDRLIGAFEALRMEELPETIGIVGAGVIGIEFAYFWNAFSVKVHIFEVQDHLLPMEDTDSSIEVETAYRRLGIKQSLGVKKVSTENNGDHVILRTVEKEGDEKVYKFDKVLIAVGMKGNTEGIGLDEVGIKTNNDFIVVNEYNQTNMENIYAIGDVSGPPLLAHVASHEGMIAAEHLSGEKTRPFDKSNIPGCIYSYPQVASIGSTERELKGKNIDYSVGKVPFRVNGKAIASNEMDGFVKVLIGNDGKLLGAHIVGTLATELIHEYSLFKSMDCVDEDIFHTIHSHPTLGETLSEAIMAAKNRSLNY